MPTARVLLLPPLLLSLLAGPATALAPKGPWDKFNYAPKSKTVYPAKVYQTVGTVDSAENLLLEGGKKHISGSLEGAALAERSYVTLDFGVEVGGLISMNILPSNSSTAPSFSLSFTESPSFIRPTASDDSTFPNATTLYDGILPVTAAASTSSSFWTQPPTALRGGFRYLTIVSNSPALQIANVSTAISFMPHWGANDLRNYTGYFYAKDPGFHDEDFLTKVWMGGAYTVQTNTVPVNTGRQIPMVSVGHWANNATLGIGSPIIVDGAKRDRAVWPGDMGIAVPTQFVSTNDLVPTRNALGTMFTHINPTTGALPESGPPLSQLNSDTYHCWTLVGTHNYWLYTGDLEWVSGIWTNYTKAVAYVEGKVNATNGLMNVTGLRDWARQGGGGFNAEGNAILYKVLMTASELAAAMSLPDLSAAYATNATNLKAAFNKNFWLPEAGMYKDNLTTTLTPQDANSFAILFNITDSPEKPAQISAGLEKNWNELGAVAPELPNTISPFIGGFELQAHFVAGNATRALDLLHREWGFILYTNLSVQSTMLEGFTAVGGLDYRAIVGYNQDPAYTSHSHGWSSGPTSALTIYVLGLSVTKVQGSEWSFAPSLAGLPAAEGGFETPLGWFGAKWTWNGKKFSAQLDVPAGTTGLVVLPSEVAGGSVQVDGKRAPAFEGPHFTLAGGKHKISVAL
ncbi:unnamed protein product [Mycena citricolor]|uniref:Glycoside hydrolase family 78 protein n=1 Tax=Mycena citricolor TaxID=2018698 RepID=A0AAD2Q3E3_9AGAR|nr:unnamed protein product [Mycena citricolor]